MSLSLTNKKPYPFLNHLCLALDVDDINTAMRMVCLLNPNRLSDSKSDFFSLKDNLESTNEVQSKNLCGGFKLGPRLLLKYGESIISEIAQYGPVFVDCKFFDITSTTVAAVRASFQAGASVVTVHAMNGYECLKALADLERELNAIRPFKILCVTILTSWSAKSFAEPGFLVSNEITKKGRSLTTLVHQTEVSSLVRDLHQLVIKSGLRGIVCSAEELNLLNKVSLSEEIFYLTPGIRLPQDDHQDQSRVMGPKQAMLAGSNVLVVGRPILQASDPRQKALDFLQL